MKKNRQICRLLLFLILIFITIPGMYGQKYIVPWANTFTEHGWDRVAAITSDTGNNIILVGVLGAFDKSCDIGQSHYNSRNFHNYVLKKYASITISLSEIFILCKTESTVSGNYNCTVFRN